MIETSFTQAMAQSGMTIKEQVVADGQLHRFNIKGDKPNSLNGWYVLYGDGVPAGSFGSWKTGQSYNWCSKEHKDLTPAERTAMQQRIEAAKSQREEEDRRIKAEARKRANEIWSNAGETNTEHPYLIAKGIKPYGIKQSGDCLVIPMRDAGGAIHSLQFIYPDGKKRFLSGGRKKGCYAPIATHTDILAICEGFATGASIHESTGIATAVSFDAGNLMPVAKSLRAKFPALDIVICADNDTETDGNPGVTKAKEAAMAINARLAIPPISGDFNDYYRGLKK